MTAQAGGASAYFSRPETTLDPSLFSGSVLKPAVSEYILGRLSGFFQEEGIKSGAWLDAWLAGSGVSYQWRANRGNGDLDVLLGIDTAGFLAANPGFSAGSRTQLAATVNEQMKKYLWPLTAATAFGDSVYEVTYYWNPEVGNDIRVIRPYAAWNLRTARWDVPPEPQPAVSDFPQDWADRALYDMANASTLYREWSGYLADLSFLPAGNPARRTAETRLQSLTAELRGLWNLLHDGRRSAFASGGQGWGDWHNYRWQAAKANGTVSLLREVVSTDDRLRAENDTRLYGAPVESAETALRRAAAAYTRWTQ